MSLERVKNFNETRKRRILVVEDTRIQALKLMHDLTESGFECEWANNGAEALELLKKSEFDLVATDLQMPIMDGLALIKELRQNSLFLHLPIIAMSTQGSEEYRLKSIELGASDFLLKGYIPAELDLRIMNNIRLNEMRKALQGENAELGAQLEQAYNEIKSKFKDLEEAHNKLKSSQEDVVRMERITSAATMTNGLAHEINNPLSVILGKVAILKMLLSKPSVDIERLRKEIGVIEEMGNGLTAMIKQMLIMARQNDGPVTLARSSLQSVYGNFNALLATIAHKHHVQLEVVAPKETIPVVCHEVMLGQVILNLAKNGIDAMEGKDPKKITVTFSSEAAHAVIEVADLGTGIPPEIQEKIFSPFFTTKAAGKGTGMGLALVKTMVDKMNGDLSFTTSTAGTTFKVRIPSQPKAQG